MKQSFKKAIVLGAGGFIGSHLVKFLKKKDYHVVGVDLKYPEYDTTDADVFHLADLRDYKLVEKLLKEPFDEVYQLAADMGGAGYLFTGENDAEIMVNSAMINLNVAKAAKSLGPSCKLFFSSSACVYPMANQEDACAVNCAEDSVYPADPDSEYGWEKLFSERLFQSFFRSNYYQVYIGRFHNVFGPYGSWNNGKEKFPAAICRKVAQEPTGGAIEIWGTGKQARSFLYIDDALEAVYKLVQSDWHQPVNIGSERMVSINELTDIAIELSGKKLTKTYVDGPVGVLARTSDNSLINDVIGWQPKTSLEDGMARTFDWIRSQMSSQ